MNLENYWEARPGASELLKIEQFFSKIILLNPHIFEAIAIYTSLRNDQYCCLEALLNRWGAEIAWFVEKYNWNHEQIGKKIVAKYKKKLVPKFDVNYK